MEMVKQIERKDMKTQLRVLFLICLLTAGVVSAADAHEKRFVAKRFAFVVGFINEPAFSGQLNGVDLRVFLNENPVEGLDKELRVTVVREQEGKSFDLEFRGKYKEPGHYAAYFLPTLPGKYIFKIKGKINGIDIDERFESGDKFNDVEDTGQVSFP